MQLGIHLVDFTGPAAGELGPTLARTGEAAEAAGVAAISLMDHYFQMDGFHPATDPMLEGYTTLGFLAAHTSTVNLGLLVTGVTYRHPGLLAKIVATLDVLSGGRGQLGLGAAWYEREHQGLGVPYPAVAERFERLEEAIQICFQMWDPDETGPYAGRHYQLAETLCRPAPLTQPRPRLLIGGGGERKTLRLVAQYANACNLFASTPDDVAHKLDVLRRHCDDVGRDYAEVFKTVLSMDPRLAAGDVDGFLTDMEAYAGLGVGEVILMPPDGAADRWIADVVAPVVPALADVGG
jgi:F420-dependent oxidoreductase-like protein